MNNLWLPFLLVALSALPAIICLVVIIVRKYPINIIWFFVFLAGGALAIIPAAFGQSLFSPLSNINGREAGNLIIRIWTQIALTEEAGKLLLITPLLLLMFYAEKIAGVKTAVDDALKVPRAGAAGFIAGLGFAIIETATYSGANFSIALLRAFTAAPLHASCGARVGQSIALIRHNPVKAIVRFITAVLIHGIYDFMVLSTGTGMPDIFPIALIAAVLFLAIRQISRPKDSELTDSMAAEDK
jgi:RsiW-degrading membrane proteinase PrsW (M82 family)